MNEHILSYIIRLYRIQERDKLDEDRGYYHRQPMSIFVSNSKENFNSGFTHQHVPFLHPSKK